MHDRINRNTRLWVYAALAVAAAGTSALADEKQDSAPFDWNTVLADPEDTASRLAAERQKIETQTAALDAPLSKAQGQLALANWWLGVATARPATRWLLGADTDADRKSIARAAEKASSSIEIARTLLSSQAAQSKDAGQKETRNRLEQSADNLAVFAVLFEVADQDPKAETTREAWRKAARKLAVAREAEDSQLAAAAQLWQAFALTRAGNRERALEILPDALAKPDRLPYDLMSRLLRCRMLADAGQFAVATSLLSRMETMLKAWLTKQPQDRNTVRRLLSFVQYRVVTQWAGQLRTSSRPTAAAPLAPVLKSIDDDFNEVKAPAIYYLPTAVPTLVTVPSSAAKPTTTPATSKPAPSSRKPATSQSQDE